MKKPVLEEFGLTSQEYTHIVAERTRLRVVLDGQLSYGLWIAVLIALPIVSLISAFMCGFFGGIAGFLVGWVLVKVIGLIEEYAIIPASIGAIVGASYGFIAVLTEPYRENRKRRRYRKLLSHPQYEKAARYEEAVKRYEYRQQKYWKSLRGTKFERALARLYKNMGYSVSQTKGSGDEGIDLILSKEAKTTVVQCKGREKPIGVGAVRDLYGAMMHARADSAVLACPAGFTKAVRNFATGKPIQLLSVADLVEMAESVDQEQ